MTIADYDAASTLMEQKLQGILLDVRQSYDAALSEIRDEDGNLDISQLGEDNTDFKSDVISNLESKVKDHYDFGNDFDARDEFDKARLMQSYFGFAQYQINDLINGLGENASFDNFYRLTTQGQGRGEDRVQPLMANLLRDMKAYPSTKLSADDAEEVITYTQTQERVDPERLTNPLDMIELINTFRQNGQIRNADLVGKNYLADDYNPNQ